MSEQTVFHVARWDGKWVVRRKGGHPGKYDCFETREEAVARARKLAERAGTGVVQID